MKKCFLSLLLLSVLVAPLLAGDVIFTNPAGGEIWLMGTEQTLKFKLPVDIGYLWMTLDRPDGAGGWIIYSMFPREKGWQTYTWTVGNVMDEDGNPVSVPYGSGYTIRIPNLGSSSNPFTISPNFVKIFSGLKYIQFTPIHDPVNCPQCGVLDLAALREALIKLHEPVIVGLYWRGRPVAEFGQIGQNRGFDAKLQVKLEPDALAAMNRGEEFELRLLNKRGQLLHSQAVRLMAASPLSPSIPQIRKR